MSIENIFPNKQQFDTINERLLEIANNVAGGSSKLDKPTNPSAESAVTLLADGTVGTKLLSEIGGGGGGGKLYIHTITINSVDGERIEGDFLSTRGTNYDVTDDFTAYFLPGSKVTYNNKTYGIKNYGNQPSNGYRDYTSFDITTYEQLGSTVRDVPTFSRYFVTEL